MSDSLRTAPAPPDGFVPLTPPGRFLNRAAHYFSRQESDGSASVGVWITADQSNSEQVAHGGFLLTFADFALSFVLTGITINLSVDFLRPVPVGSWLEINVKARRRSTRLIFADAVATCDGGDAFRVSGIFNSFEKRS